MGKNCLEIWPGKAPENCLGIRCEKSAGKNQLPQMRTLTGATYGYPDGDGDLACALHIPPKDIESKLKE
jgi:hypothetical protein